jgi:dTDP-4-dehydrorhamnose reductase
MRILLTGARGLLGSECVRVLHPRHDLLTPDRGELDITAAPQVDEVVARFRPEVILNCAAFTQVDLCETRQEQAFAANVAGPRHLALAAARHGAYLIHISTDYVFDGRKPPPTPYEEDDPTGPLSWYGRTKLAGELAVQEAGGRSAIVRTSWLYGRRGSSFLKKILAAALNPAIPELKVVDDQFGCPTWARRLAEQLARLLEAGATGIFHAAAQGHCTWFGLASRFLALMGIAKPLRPCPSRDYPTPAVRPHNSILATRRLMAAGLHCLRPWQEDLEEFVREAGADLLREARGLKADG